MIRIQYNKLTGRVIGTEIILGNNPSTRDCVDSIDEFVDYTGNCGTILKDKLYFIDGKLQILEDAEPDYFDKRRELEWQIQSARENVSRNSDSALTERLLSGMSLEEALQDMQGAKNTLDSLTAELEELDRQYKEDLWTFYAEQDAQELAGLNPEKYSAVCLLIRDENQYLEEWVRHYIDLGVDLICIYDNGIDESVSDVIYALEEDIQDRIDIIPYHDINTTTLQQDVCNDFIDRYRDKVRWAAFVDSDEFIELVEDGGINDFLKGYEEHGSVFMNWVMHTANGQEVQTEGTVRERFTEEFQEPKNHIYRYQGKEFIQIYKVDTMVRYHAVFLRDAGMYINENLNMDIIKLRHYYTKSLEEWERKISRGSCDSTYRKSYQEFFKLNPDMDYLNTGEDYRQEYGPDLEKKAVVETESE